MTYIIAEVGSNFRTFENCVECIELAAECGADAVKFQKYDDVSLYGFDAGKDMAQYSIDGDWIPELSAHAKDLQIDFGVTFFNCEDVDKYGEYVDFFKIASSDMNDHELFMAIKKKRTSLKKVYISTGGHTLLEIGNRYHIIKSHLSDNEFDFMYCDSSYPAESIDSKKVFDLFRMISQEPCISDHTVGIAKICLSNEMFKYNVVEKHVNLLDIRRRPDSGEFAISYNIFADMVKKIKMTTAKPLEKTEDSVLKSEESMRLLHNRRLVAIKKIAKDDILKIGDNFGYFRGLAPEKDYLEFHHIDVINGTEATRDYGPGNSITI